MACGDGTREVQELRKELRTLNEERDAEVAQARRELGAMTRARDEAREKGDEARAALRRKLGGAEAGPARSNENYFGGL